MPRLYRHFNPYRISRPRISQGTERQSHPNRDDVLTRYRERPPESDS